MNGLELKKLIGIINKIVIYKIFNSQLSIYLTWLSCFFGIFMFYYKKDR